MEQNCIYWFRVTVHEQYPDSIISTNIDFCISNIDFAMVSFIPLSTLAVRCAYWDHEEKKQKVCFVTHSFLVKVLNYPKFQGFGANDCDNWWIN